MNKIIFYAEIGSNIQYSTTVKDFKLPLNNVLMKYKRPSPSHIAEENGEWVLPDPDIKRKEEILVELDRIDAKSARPMRAMLADTATDDDKKVLAEMEEEAKKLRDELNGLNCKQVVS